MRISCANSKEIKPLQVANVPVPLWVSFATPLRIQIESVSPAPAELRAVFTLLIASVIVKGENMSTTMQAFSLASVSVEWKDATGSPAHVDGPTTWQSSDPSVVKATVSAGNPQICNLESFAKIGDVSIQATADADLGQGVRTVTALLAITVIGGEATGGDITFHPGGPGPASPSSGSK
jgi:hypothetical protein